MNLAGVCVRITCAKVREMMEWIFGIQGIVTVLVSLRQSIAVSVIFWNLLYLEGQNLLAERIEVACG